MDDFPDWIDLIALGPLLIQAAFWAAPIRRRTLIGDLKEKRPRLRDRKVNH